MPTIVKLTPPVIDPQTILSKTTGMRSVRQGCFNISAQQIGGKQIIHCYGHGGAGITTLFGSINEAIRLMREQFKIQQNAPIRVIGAGCMGLTAAIELKRQGYAVKGIIAKEQYDIISWKAGGYFALVSTRTSQEQQSHLNRIGEETFKTYQTIAQNKHPYLSRDIARYMPIFASKGTQSGLEELVEAGFIPSPIEVTLDFGNGVRHSHFQKYETYYIEVAGLMHQLTAEVARLRIPIQICAIEDFQEIPEEIVFNCTGFGAKQLNRDALVTGVLGHLLLLNKGAGMGHMDYMIYAEVEQAGRLENLYLFPKTTTRDFSVCQGVIGGTFIPNTEDLSLEAQNELNEIEFQKMMARSCLFFHGK